MTLKSNSIFFRNIRLHVNASVLNIFLNKTIREILTFNLSYFSKWRHNWKKYIYLGIKKTREFNDNKIYRTILNNTENWLANVISQFVLLEKFLIYFINSITFSKKILTCYCIIYIFFIWFRNVIMSRGK